MIKIFHINILYFFCILGLGSINSSLYAVDQYTKEYLLTQAGSFQNLRSIPLEEDSTGCVELSPDPEETVDYFEKSATIHLEYSCEAPGLTFNLKSLSLVTSTGQEYETSPLTTGNTWMFSEYGKQNYNSLLVIKKTDLPLNFSLRWLSNNAKLSEMRKHLHTNLTTLPLNAWVSWEELEGEFILTKEDLFDERERQKIFKIIIFSPTHGSQETSLVLFG